MSSFASSHGSDAPAPAPPPTGAASGQVLAKPSVPWEEVMSMFETMSIPKPRPQLIAANTTLEQDKETVLRCWLAMGGKEDALRRGYLDQQEWKFMMRDAPSDDPSEWFGVTVEGHPLPQLRHRHHQEAAGQPFHHLNHN